MGRELIQNTSEGLISTEPFRQPVLFGYDFLTLFLLLFFILSSFITIGVALALLKRLFGKTPKQKNPYEILMDRFASGEIGKNEFEEKKRLLGIQDCSAQPPDITHTHPEIRK